MAKISYYTKLSGVSFRQKTVAKVKPGKTELRVLAIDDNEYDPFACEVQALTNDGWEQIGWIQKGKNEDIHKHIKSGGVVTIKCTDITGEGKETLGVNVSVEYGDDSVDLSSMEKQIAVFGDEPFVYFDATKHEAFDANGHQLVSGSMSEEQYVKKPNFEYAAKALAKKTGLKKEDIMSLWEAKGELAQMYGNLIHRAAEINIEYNEVIEGLNEAQDNNPGFTDWGPAGIGKTIDAIEEALNNKFELDYSCLYTEARIKYKNLTGIADLIHMKDGEFYLFDYKTNKEIKEVNYVKFGKHSKYTVQQNHYRAILEGLGYKCKGMFLLHHNGEKWNIIKIDRIDLEQEIL